MSSDKTEHDPSGCDVCARLGDWTTESDTEQWLREHAGAGRPVRIERCVGGSRVVDDRR